MVDVEGETAARAQVLAHARQAGELILLRKVVQEGAKGRDDQREAFGQREGTHVADGGRHAPAHVRRQRSQLLLKPVEHRRIGVQRVDPATGLRDLERDAARASPKLENRASGVSSS